MALRIQLGDVWRIAAQKSIFIFLLVFLTGITGGKVMADEITVIRSSLFSDLWGYAENTTGGLGGQLYVVNRREDSLEEGTLRYGVEALSGPTWIVFDPTVFPSTRKRPIYLSRPLQLRSNITIDGRGSYVSIRKRYYWEDAGDWEQDGDGYRCMGKESPSHDVGEIIKLRNVENVIITHLDFKKEYVGETPNPNPRDPRSKILDKECFEDVISIYSADSGYFDNIWINQSNFRDCGDECIGITHPHVRVNGRVTISNNKFAYTYKGILLGNDESSRPFQILASVYRNHFDAVRIRQPRIKDAIAHVFNNVYEDWRAYVVESDRKSRAMTEQNVFRAVTSRRNLCYMHDDADDAHAWGRNNVYTRNIDRKEKRKCETQSFPKCEASGGPWYFPCRSAIIDVKRLPYQTAINTLRSFAGWKNVSNDVRDRETSYN